MTDDSCILFYRVRYCISYRTENKLFYFILFYFILFYVNRIVILQIRSATPIQDMNMSAPVHWR
jgi:hypothetical protein